MKPTVQVWDGSDDGYYAELARKQDLRERTFRSLEQLVRDLRSSARYLPTPGMISNRLVFVEELVNYLKGEKNWSIAVAGYRDLQEISSLYVAMKNHENMVERVCKVLKDIDEFRQVFRAA